MKLDIKRTIKKETNITTIVDYLLQDRKIPDIKSFINPQLPENIHLSSFFKNSKEYQSSFGKIIKLLKEIQKKEKTIVVYTDYDADGITGGAILWETLHLLGFKVMPYVPDRKTEGYGFSKKGIDNIKKQFDPALIISVDHGIVAHEQIAYAKSIGMPVIVTDHHQKLDKKHDDALAVFHTDKLSGSGVAYFFSKEIFNKLKQFNHRTIEQLNNNFLTDYLGLASIGTIADLVPLVGPSRSIVKYGLEQLSKTKRLGISHLLKETKIDGKDLSPYEVGFIIAPRINAFGRLTHAIDALRLLCTVNVEKAVALAKKAGETNKQRQELVTEAIKEAEKMVSSTSLGASNQKLIILYSDHWEEGIIGLIASKIVEKFYRPAVIMTKSDGFYKGSARSISGFDITAFLRSLSKYLVDIGGHQAAAGFTIKESDIEIFIKEAQKKAKKHISNNDLIPRLEVDMELLLQQTSLKLVQELQRLEPFGVGNRRPLFYSIGQISDARLFGSKSNHLKLQIKSNDSSPLEIIFFNQGDRFSELSIDKKIGIVYSLEIDSWDGRMKVRGMGKYIQLL